MKKASDQRVFEQPDLDKAEALRPEVVARLELLKIVWRPDRDAAHTVKVCEELEKYLGSKR